MIELPKPVTKEELLASPKESFFKQNVEFEQFLIQSDISYQVEQEMEAKGMKKKELAARMGVSASYLSQLFGGFTKMSLTDIAKIKIALDMDLAFKFYEKNTGTITSVEEPDTSTPTNLELNKVSVEGTDLSFYGQNYEDSVDYLKVTKSISGNLAA